MALDALPIDDHLSRIASLVRKARAAVIVASPGAGKTTRVPPALLDAGRVIVLQPRRVAARAIARRIASERGWRAGEEVGWHVRFEQRFTPATRLLLATEGILTARLQQDPLLSGFATVILDEFHERSIHADLALALARQAWLARDDLRLVVMSATLDPDPISRFLGGCPVIDVPGREHPVSVEHLSGAAVPEAIGIALARTAGDVLCFLPGALEIERAAMAVQASVRGLDVLPLHGALRSDQQDRVFDAAPSRRVILATNIAETSITVPRVTAVVDTGWQKVARYDAARAIDSLELERITQDSAEQRAGRAGRTAPGVALRLWDARDRLRPHREAEIERVDLSATLLDVIAWGGDAAALEWFQPPPESAVRAGLDLLERLGAVKGGRLTAAGRQLQRVPLHPRLARILVAAGGAWEAAVACAVLAERTFVPAGAATTSCDLLAAVDRERDLPPHVRAVARQVHRVARSVLGDAAVPHADERRLRQALLAGYPDRVARRRQAGSPRLLMSSGTGAVLSPESGVSAPEFLVALDLRASSGDARREPQEARVRLASAVEREWLEPTDSTVEHRLDEQSGSVRAVRRARYGALTLAERPVAPDPETAAALIAAAYLSRDPSAGDLQLVRRLAFAGHRADLGELARRAARGVTRLADLSLRSGVPAEILRTLDALAPERISLPSRRTAALEYREDGTVAAAAKLQELFGLADTPRVGSRREPVLLLLLAPNGRAVQTTRDLRSFWERTYPEVRKELRGRYPRHPWPEDPWSAQPTARTVRKKKS